MPLSFASAVRASINAARALATVDAESSPDAPSALTAWANVRPARAALPAPGGEGVDCGVALSVATGCTPPPASTSVIGVYEARPSAAGRELAATPATPPHNAIAAAQPATARSRTIAMLA